MVVVTVESPPSGSGMAQGRDHRRHRILCHSFASGRAAAAAT
jgi:hypothetical protein